MELAPDKPIALISDIHANKEALDAVLEDIAEQGIDTIVNLGDTVGYGPDPLYCLAKAREFDLNIAGNHDTGLLAPPFFYNSSERAKEVLSWTRQQLANDPDSKSYIDFLASLMPTFHGDYGNTTLSFFHGTPEGPLNGYLASVDRMGEAYATYFEKRFPTLSPKARGAMQELFTNSYRHHMLSFIDHVAFVGHVHIQGVLTRTTYFGDPAGNSYAIEPDEKAIICVGSVGQPRSGDKATYVVLDDHSVHFRSVKYDIGATVQKIFTNNIGGTSTINNDLARTLRDSE
jgi:predicted phosphodiesterase